MFKCFLFSSLINFVKLMFFAVDSVVPGCIRCHVRKLVSKLQESRQIDDACSLMGMVTACGQQLKEYSCEFVSLIPQVMSQQSSG